MTVHFIDVDLEKNIKVLAALFDVEPVKVCQELIVNIPSHYGAGTITAYNFNHGISLLIFNCQLEENLEIVINSTQLHPIHFHFCIKENFKHSLMGEEMSYQLHPLGSSITINPVEHKQTLHFPKGGNILHVNLQLISAVYLDKLDCDLQKIPEPIIKIFQDMDESEAFLYEGNYGIRVSECLKKIMEATYKHIIRATFIEGKTLELLSLQLNQFKNDHDPERRFMALKKHDLDRILKAKEILISDLRHSPTIIDLAKMSGINQQKLKKGFKQIFGATINEYLRNVRLEAALNLLMKGDLLVGDVAKQIGYANQSHFARRFKEKYGMLPKEALRTIRSEISKT